MEVPEGHAGVITRMGRFHATVGPGPVSLLPVADKLLTVDLRPRVILVGPLDVSSLDNRPFRLNGKVFFQVFEPRLALLTVDTRDYLRTLVELWSMVSRRTTTHGTGDELVAQLPAVSAAVGQAMNPITEQFGVRVSRVELEVEPAPEPNP